MALTQLPTLPSQPVIGSADPNGGADYAIANNPSASDSYSLEPSASVPASAAYTITEAAGSPGIDGFRLPLFAGVYYKVYQDIPANGSLDTAPLIVEYPIQDVSGSPIGGPANPPGAVQFTIVPISSANFQPLANPIALPALQLRYAGPGPITTTIAPADLPAADLTDLESATKAGVYVAAGGSFADVATDDFLLWASGYNNNLSSHGQQGSRPPATQDHISVALQTQQNAAAQGFDQVLKFLSGVPNGNTAVAATAVLLQHLNDPIAAGPLLGQDVATLATSLTDLFHSPAATGNVFAIDFAYMGTAIHGSAVATPYEQFGQAIGTALGSMNPTDMPGFAANVGSVMNTLFHS